MWVVTQTYADQLRAEAARLEPEVAYSRTEAFELPLKRLFEAEQQFAKAWSGSNLGFHSCIYYKGFSRHLRARISPPSGVSKGGSRGRPASGWSSSATRCGRRSAGWPETRTSSH
jgi:hypothetical protein